MPAFYTEHEAAELLRVHPGTLANWRWLSKGPAFYRLEGKILYSKKDLARYMSGARYTDRRRRIVAE